ncbi:hypothetical protein [Bacillus sp. SG-1]|uniref:hypothetical protein n=1 Tax=Bacillus sp. SG-1 TaxID=161544 RepID=UPI000154525C|nr:hypothetical protein [Bacillus sp. SG-1]EDL64681.1 hypothetical protein BSG1_01165 [Bacillus sp. SG-1]
MELYIFALIAFVILLPVLFFLPGGMTKKGRVWIAGGSLLISLLGLLALNQYPLWMVAIILFILVIVSSLVIGNRFGPQLLADGGVQDADNFAADADNVVKEEKIFFAAVDEVDDLVEDNPEEADDFSESGINMDSEENVQEDTLMEFITNEELEELPLLTVTDDSVNKVESVQDNDETEEIIIDEDTSVEELSELEWLIQQEEQEDTGPVHTVENDEGSSDSEESLEELPIMDIQEKPVLPDEEMEPLSEIELMIHEAEDEPSILEPADHEPSQETSNTIPEESDELQPILLDDNEIKFFQSDYSEEDQKLVELFSAESSETDSITPEEELLVKEALSDMPVVLEEELDDLSDDGSSEEEMLQDAESEPSDLEEGILSEPMENTEHESQDEIHSEFPEGVQEESEVRSPLQTLVIQTIVEELAYYKNKMSLAEFEALIAQYMHPKLHDRDYYVLSQQLIQRYNELKEYKKLKLFIDEIEERFISYPVLKSELNDYKEIAWKNIVKE